MPAPLTHRALHGIKWSLLSVAIGAILQVAVTMVTARLLDPAAFGIAAVSMLVVSFGSQLTHAAIGAAIVRAPDFSGADASAVLVVSGTAGAVLFGATVALSVPLAALLGDAALAPYMRGAAVAFLILGLSVVSVSLMRRDGRFRALAAIEVGALAAGPGTVGIAMAAAGMGAWSLIAASVAAQAVIGGATLWLVRSRLAVPAPLRTVLHIFSYAVRHGLSNLTEFFIYHSHTVLISRMYSATEVGLYSRAGYLVQIPAERFANAVRKVALPTIGETQKSAERLRNAYLSFFLFFGVSVLPVTVSMAIAAPEIVAVVLGPAWAAAVPLLSVLAVAVGLNLCLHFHALAIDIKARLGLKLCVRILHLATIVALYLHFGPDALIGFAYAFLIAEAAFFIVNTAIVSRILDIPAGDLLGRLLAVAYASGCCAAAVFAGASLLRAAAVPSAALLAAEIVLGALALGFATVLFPPPVLRSELRNRLFSGHAELPAALTGNPVFGWCRNRLSA